MSPTKVVTLYQQDLNKPAYGNDYYHDFSLRLTWQAAQKHKVVVSYGNQPNCSCYYPLLESAGGTLPSPEATGQHTYNVNYLPLVSWSYPATNRLLFEAGASANVFNNHTKRQTEDNVTTDILAIENQTTNYRYGSRATGLTHAGGYRVQHNRQYRQRFATSYITGSHNFKTGLELAEYREGAPLTDNTDLNQIHGGVGYRFSGTSPNRVTLWAIPYEAINKSKEYSVFGQDQWTAGRMTLNLGLRFSKYTGYVPATVLPAGPWVPERSLPEVKNSPDFTNLNSRLGMSYDLFGNGKTALKGSLGRFNPYNIAAVDIPANNQAASTTITWTDSNTNYYPDCNLKNPAGENNVAAGGDVCGKWSELSFGQVRQGNTYRAADAKTGFNTAEVQWQGSVSVQHELWTNVALNVGYFRTWYSNFLATDNKLTTASDFDSFCVMAPVDTRLGDMSGQEVCGLYDVSAAKFGQTLNEVTQASNYDTQHKQVEVFNGMDVTINARFHQGGQFSGGLSMGRTSTDNCYTNGNPQLANTGATILLPRSDSYCNVVPPWASSTQLKFLFVYPLPYEVQASAIYQNIPGIPLRASKQYTNAEVQASATNPHGLTRNLSACSTPCAASTNVEIDLLPPNQTYEDRLSQLDLRFSKIFRFGKTRTQGSFDLYNLFNASNILNEYTRYTAPGGTFMSPISIMGGRLMKFTVQFDF